jgi:hypothetical protein
MPFSILPRLHEQEPDPAAGGAGGDDVAAAVRKAVDEAVAGLKSKNSELLGKLKERDDKLKSFDGIDPVAVSTMLKRFADDEEAGLIKAGKIDEVLTKAKALSKADKLAARTLAGALRDAAIKTGALPEAMDDIVLRAGSVWRLNDDGEPVAINGDEVILGKDGKTPLSPMEWAESLRETAPHLWPKAQGTNAPGSGSGPRGSNTKGKVDGTPEERTAYFKSKYSDLA